MVIAHGILWLKQESQVHGAGWLESSGLEQIDKSPVRWLMIA